jgi:acetoacetyl-CoA synthetase
MGVSADVPGGFGRHGAGAPEVLWSPPPDARERSRMGRWLTWLERERGLAFDAYADAWRWSTDDLGGFWSSVWEHFEVRSEVAPTVALADRSMPGARWFPGTRPSYAEHALRLPGRAGSDVVVIAASQTRPTIRLTADELRDRVARARAGLERIGVRPGDRVVGYLPNIPETLVAFLATAALGATWSACSPEMGVRGVLDRFGQLEPTVLVAVDGYRHGTRAYDRRDAVAAIRAGLPTLRATVAVPYLAADHGGIPDALVWDDLLAEPAGLAFEPVAFEQPLFILFSSGTTGRPKAIVHGHGGILLEHLKALGLHTDLGPADRFLWQTTTSWMMWDYLVSGLLLGSTIVLFDGDPTHPDLRTLWRLAADEAVTYLGAGAPFLMACRRAGLRPAAELELGHLRGVGSTGAPLPAEGFHWVRDHVSAAIPLGSLSGGTDVCTGFLGPSPLVPVWAGEMSCRMLGAKVEAWDPDGRAVVGTRGELVITAPMPSMPLGFWGDPDGSRYRASYFGRYPGAWWHGDWLTITERGSCVVSGRSDATLNRGGVRLGTAELYAVVEELPEVADSLVVHLEDDAGGPGELLLFVVLAPGRALDEALRGRLAESLRRELSPRHVPDDIVAVPAIPRTLSGKKLEVPVKRILRGAPPDEVAARDALVDPAAIDPFVTLASARATAAGARR